MCSLQTNTENVPRMPLWLLVLNSGHSSSAFLSGCGTCRCSLRLSHFDDLFLIKHLYNSNLLLSQVAWSGDAAQPLCCYGNYLWSKKFYLFILGFWVSVALGFRASPAGPDSLHALLEGFVPYFMHIMKSQCRKKGEGNAQINLKPQIPQTKALER